MLPEMQGQEFLLILPFRASNIGSFRSPTLVRQGSLASRSMHVGFEYEVQSCKLETRSLCNVLSLCA
jgi:hypothetical protein